MTNTPTNTPSDTYIDNTYVTSDDGKVRACFIYIGEGYNGEFDETDPDDAALYRLDIEVSAGYADKTWAEPTDDPDWVYPAGGSICTSVEMDKVDNATCLDLLGYAANQVAEALATDTNSVKDLMDDLSYLPTKR